MEFLVAACGTVLNVAVEPFRRQLGYIYNYRSNVKELENCAETLKAKRQFLKNRVEEAERNGETVEDCVTCWLKDTDEKITEIDKFLEDEGRQRTGCSNGLFPNLRLLHQRGRKAKKMSAQDVQALLEQARDFDGVSHREKPNAAKTALHDGDYVAFDSRDAVVQQVMNALKDSTVKMIGIHGPGGVGKTTLVKAVGREAQEKKLFNVVVMANITSTPDVRKIQGQLSDMLGLRLEEESEIGRAGRLRERLKMEKENTLVILDDLWTGLDLNMLGIPFNDDDSSQRTDKGMPNFGHDTLKKEESHGDSKSCKILLTSRSKEVLSSEMNVEENSIFPVEVLEEKDAEELFNKVAGITDKDSELKSLSAKIAKKFAMLPMAIVAAGKALKSNKNKLAWENALLQIERQEMTGVLEPVEFSTKLSYDHLQSEELKSIFLLCSRMGEDPSVMDLVKYCIGLGIFQGVSTFKEARDRTKTLINKLEHSSLLLNNCSSDQVTMHDMVRDAALSIASKEQHAFTLRYGKLDEWPDKDKVESYTAISLYHSDIIDEIPEGINCPRLKVFHVESKDPFLKIPDKLFAQMGELRVLILIGINLSSLPSSIRSLTKLRMLCLEQCVLGDNLSMIGELKKLRVLSLSGSEFESLPSQLGQLGKLQFFDISNCTRLRVIPSYVLSSMNSLEELHMENNLIQWSVEGQKGQSGIASLDELRHLQHLKSLDIYIPNVAAFPGSLFFDKLDSYKIVIGDFKMLLLGDFEMPCKYEASRALALQLKKSNDIHFQKGFKMLFKRVEQLILGELDGVRNLIYELNLEGFPCLKRLAIIKNFEIQYIINSMERGDQVMAFPELESICLYKLERIQKICNCQLIDDSFRSLKTLKVKFCGRLKNLFSFCMVRLLTKLEKIEVSECDSLEEIVAVETQEDTDHNVEDDCIPFPQLRSLTLRSLPILTCFYANHKMVPISQMKENQLLNREPGETSIGEEQGFVAPLFNAKISVPNLEKLKLSSINIKKLWGDQPLPSPSIKNLTILDVKDCGSLTYLFSLPVARSLENLQSLFVRGCDIMKDIFKPETNSMDEVSEVKLFPQLKKIEIASMEGLKTIWHAQASSDSYRSLDSVVIENCDKLVSVFPGYMVGKFQSLGSLKVINCKLVQEIFDLQATPQKDDGNETNLRDVRLERLPKLKHIWSKDPQGILNFKNLENISIFRCPDLEVIFPVSVANDLQKSAKCIRVFACDGMKEIVARDDASCSSPNKFVLPKLTTLTLELLPELRCFCQGTHTIEFQALKCLLLLRCDKLVAFAAETANPEVQPILSASVKVISKLERLGIGPSEMEWLQRCIGNNVYQLRNIKLLILDGLKRIENLFWFLNRFPNLEVLTLFRSVIKEVLPNGSPFSHEKIGTVVQPKDLNMWYAHFLQNIGFENDPILQRVERLYIEQCHFLINLMPSSVSFTHLTNLEVSNCKRLKNLMTSSTAQSLVQLTAMKVTQCEMMEEIVTEEGNEEERGNEIVFNKLKNLELVSLTNLTSFCSSKNKLAFPSLEKLTLRDCLKMEKFSEKITSTPNLKKVDVVEDDVGVKGYWEGDLNATTRKMFEDKVPLEYIQNLELSCHPQVQEVWQGEVSLPENSFGNLKALVVAKCPFLSKVFPSKLLPYLKSLEELKVHSSPVEVIFDIDDNNLTEINGKAFYLKRLTLQELPSLKRVWSKDPHGIISFPNLQEVVANDCVSLETLFPAYLAENLGQLKKLEIMRNIHFKEIVENKEEAADGACRKFEFYNLTSLNLYDLPGLECFYPGRYTLECPNLDSLRVCNCNKLDIFVSEFQSHQEALRDEGQVGITRSRQPLFLVEKVIPNLEKVSINGKDTKMLSQGHSPKLLHKIKDLELSFHDFNEAASSLPFGFLQKVPNLECLSIGFFQALVEIFPSQKPEDIDAISILARIRALSLDSLPSLSSIGLDNSWLDPLHKNLEELRVAGCPGLTVLIPCSSTVSFCKLRKVTISRCHGLVCMFSSSVAKSLVQLQTMIIEECKSIEQIVAHETDESTSDEIIFGKLDFLALRSLPSLVRFYSGNATLQFSILPTAVIDQCPKMIIFSQGVVRAPHFSRIRASSDPQDLHRYGDLDTTVQKLFYNKLEHLILKGHAELEEVWHGVVPVPDYCFCNLKFLVINQCEFLSTIVPSHLLPLLCNLEELKVQKCDTAKAIFDVKDTKGLKFGYFKKLTLEELPNLEHIFSKDPQGNFSLLVLQEAFVRECNGLQSLFPESVAKDLLQLEELHVENCEGLEEIVTKEAAASDGGTQEPILFPCVTSLTLCNLPMFRCISSGMHSLRWPMLKKLDVYHCDKLNIFTSVLQCCQESLPEALVSVEKGFPNLEEISLTKESTMMVRHDDFQTNLEKLKCLKLQCYHNESDIFPCGFLQKVTNIEKLKVSCSSFKEIFSSERPDLDDAEFLPKLKELAFSYLSELKSIGFEHSWLRTIPENLKSLEVDRCPCLINLLPFTVSFSSLTNLDVSDCDGLEYLLTSSTANGLSQLEELSISKCGSIIEIAANEDESDVDEITFGKLKRLTLVSLPRLGSFHSGKLTLNFPSMELVTVDQCPRMRIFSGGAVNAPKHLEVLVKAHESKNFPLETCGMDLNGIFELNFPKHVE